MKKKVKYVGIYPINHQCEGFVGAVKMGDIIEVYEKNFNDYYKTNNDWKLEKENKKKEVK